MARLLAVIVGCNYQGSGRPDIPPLSSAESDARSFAGALLRTPSANDGIGIALSVLLGAEATTDKIRTAVEQAKSEQTPDDTLLVYFSGHGSTDGHGLILYTWDSAFRAADLLNEFRDESLPVRIILDCCHAGAIAGAALSGSSNGGQSNVPGQ